MSAGTDQHAAPPASAGSGTAALRWALGSAYWVLLPLACLVLLAMGVDSLAHHLDNTPSGVRGNFTVTTHQCHNGICITGGIFISEDGRLRETDLLGDYRWHIGETHPAAYQLSAIDVIPLPATWDPGPTVAGLAGVVMFLGAWAWVLVGAWCDRRRLAGSRLG